MRKLLSLGITLECQSARFQFDACMRAGKKLSTYTALLSRLPAMKLVRQSSIGEMEELVEY